MLLKVSIGLFAAALGVGVLGVNRWPQLRLGKVTIDLSPDGLSVHYFTNQAVAEQHMRIVRADILVETAQDEAAWPNLLVPVVVSDLSGIGVCSAQLPLVCPLAVIALALAVIHYCRGHAEVTRQVCSDPNCDYDLTGNTSGRCPECGSAVPRNPDASDG